jgi:hypothetical protein
MYKEQLKTKKEKNMSLEKEFIPYEQALALKELGFDEPCFGIWMKRGNKLDVIYVAKQEDAWMAEQNDGILAPLYQQAFRWFRNVYKLQAEILWRGDMESFCYKTGKFKYGSHDFSKDDYSTYEEAELACLNKLIELVKTK